MMKQTISRLNQADIHAFLLVAGFANRNLVQQFARHLSRLADGPAYCVVGLLLALLEPRHGSAFLLAGLCSYALELPLYVFLKRLFKRARPFRQLNCGHRIVPADEFSFPSGHTAAAAVFAGLLGIFYVESVLLLSAFVAAVGAARVVLGVHFPGDILAGALLGLACVFVVAVSMPSMGDFAVFTF
ncbi:undecaprenyl-diphosphatase [Simiduia aestuariiviva]|uniref:undecaprenyl-diphosphate phosphatase n=2 Tax=Simiduia aestuariiviva TaxID=1510459 RepID=A0A839UP32_9GAMM|nr:undecaprenyl-diphosphatase [Simiduia aestuariiviva]